MKEQGSSFIAKPIAADGLDNCRMALAKASLPNKEFNFVEGMGCVGGCIGGPCCLTHEVRDKSEIDKHGQEARPQSIGEAIKNYK